MYRSLLLTTGEKTTTLDKTVFLLAAHRVNKSSRERMITSCDISTIENLESEESIIGDITTFLTRFIFYARYVCCQICFFCSNPSSPFVIWSSAVFKSSDPPATSVRRPKARLALLLLSQSQFLRLSIFCYLHVSGRE